MKINDLIELISDGYPDDLLKDNWNFTKRKPVGRPHGDTLALFIVREIKETFDPQATDEEQLAEAMRLVDMAQNDLGGLYIHLLDIHNAL